MLRFNSTGLICKALCLGLIHFTGETLSVSFQKFYSINGSYLMGVRGVTIRIMVVRYGINDAGHWDHMGKG